MSFAGTVVNGSIVLDGLARLPEGSRVEVDIVEDGDDIGAPPEPFDYQEHLAALRESYAGIKLGLGRPAEEVMAELRAKHNLPQV
jgi:hypothetical protein